MKSFLWSALDFINVSLYNVLAREASYTAEFCAVKDCVNEAYA